MEISLKKHTLNLVKELVPIALVAGTLILLLRMFVLMPFSVTGASMEPTFSHDSHLIVERVSHRFFEPDRGNLIVFRYPKNPKERFMKRVVGLPNETVNIKNNSVTITDTSGKIFQLEEPYANGGVGSSFQMKLGPDDFFVLGDNRSQSSDSREWGPVERQYLIGRVLFEL